MMLMIIFFVAQNYKNKPITEILDVKKLKAVDSAIESANGLPNECYTSEDYLAYEKERIFCDKWTVIGVGSSIPNKTSSLISTNTVSALPLVASPLYSSVLSAS